MKLTFVIPVLNEEESLEILYNEIMLCNPIRDYEIIFIDDGSRDSTWQIMTALATKDPRVKAIRFRRNFGKAAALQVGFQQATGDYVFTMDADLQDNPIEIPNFIAKLEEGYDLVSGWKKKRHDPIYKTLPSKVFNFFTARTFRLKLQDYNCGYKLYRNSIVKEITLYGEMHRYIPALAHALGYNIAEIPVIHRSRQYGVSKYGIERYLRGFFDLLTVKMVTTYVKSPLYLFGRVGMISTLLGTIITVYLTVLKLFFGLPLTNRPLLFLGIMLILAGLQFLSLGLISELIVNRSQSSENRSISIKQSLNLDVAAESVPPEGAATPTNRSA